MANNAIQDLGNGAGFLYITQPDGVTIISSIPNDLTGKQAVLEDGLIRAPISGEILGTSTITFSGSDDDVTVLAVNGVSIISGTVSAQGTIVQTVAAVRDNINGFISSPQYTASSSGDVLTIHTSLGVGSGANNYPVVITTGMDTVVTPISGGAPPTGLFDAATGHRYFLNANYTAEGCTGNGTATAGSLVNSVEITQYIIMRGLQSSFPFVNVTIDDGNLSIGRQYFQTNVIVETEGLIASDDLRSIETVGFDPYDIIYITGNNTDREVVVVNRVSGNDNIILSSSGNFTTGNKARGIALQYIPVGNNKYWYERFRSPAIDITVPNFRLAGIPQGVSGVNTTTLTDSGGVINLTAGTDKQLQRIIGSDSLVGSYNFNLENGLIAGDTFWFDYKATMTVNANTITIGGITLTTQQALEGGYTVKSVWDGSDWSSQIFKSVEGVDLVDTVQLATKENYLGLPAADGYLLSSTALGVRIWVPGANSTGINAVKVTIPAGQMLTAFDTPVTLIAAQGSGKVIDVISVATNLNYNSVPYDTNTTINIGSDGKRQYEGDILGYANDTRRKLPVAPINDDDSVADNKAIKLSVEDGNPANGDSSMTLYLFYRVITL